MKKNKTILTFFVLLPLLALSFHITKSIGNEKVDKKAGSEITWHTFDKGLARAKAEKKVLVVDFYTDWCHWCKVMDKETYKNSDVIDYAKKNVVMAKIDAETMEQFNYKGSSYTGRQLTQMFGVNGFPATVFFTKEGDLITPISGYIPADNFLVIVKYLAEGWYEKMKFEDFQKQEADKI